MKFGPPKRVSANNVIRPFYQRISFFLGMFSERLMEPLQLDTLNENRNQKWDGFYLSWRLHSLDPFVNIVRPRCRMGKESVFQRFHPLDFVTRIWISGQQENVWVWAAAQSETWNKRLKVFAAFSLTSCGRNEAWNPTLLAPLLLFVYQRQTIQKLLFSGGSWNLSWGSKAIVRLCVSVGIWNFKESQQRFLGRQVAKSSGAHKNYPFNIWKASCENAPFFFGH